MLLESLPVLFILFITNQYHMCMCTDDYDINANGIELENVVWVFGMCGELNHPECERENEATESPCPPLGRHIVAT